MYDIYVILTIALIFCLVAPSAWTSLALATALAVHKTFFNLTVTAIADRKTIRSTCSEVFGEPFASVTYCFS